MMPTDHDFHSYHAYLDDCYGGHVGGHDVEEGLAGKASLAFIRACLGHDEASQASHQSAQLDAERPHWNLHSVVVDQTQQEPAAPGR